ncbi:proline-rich protein HaeIII subfamily 1-like [Felis catus]|uniref:proline-rich protein HaeIII subfamily 1-like n=1 Tax=Felis catus TaxID=9685 RepID=UPI001D1A3125|nr:proline-rich protein HaeIII subfamily 1-like [Felis catus]
MEAVPQDRPPQQRSTKVSDPAKVSECGAPGLPPDSPRSGFTSSSALPRPRTFQVCPTPSRGPPPKALGLLPLLLIPHSAPQPQRFPRAGPPQCDMSTHPDRPLWTPSPLYPRLPAPLPRPAWGAAPCLPDPLPGEQKARGPRGGLNEGGNRERRIFRPPYPATAEHGEGGPRRGLGQSRLWRQGPDAQGPREAGPGCPRCKVAVSDPHFAGKQGLADSTPGPRSLDFVVGTSFPAVALPSYRPSFVPNQSLSSPNGLQPGGSSPSSNPSQPPAPPLHCPPQSQRPV